MIPPRPRDRLYAALTLVLAVLLLPVAFVRRPGRAREPACRWALRMRFPAEDLTGLTDGALAAFTAARTRALWRHGLLIGLTSGYRDPLRQQRMFDEEVRRSGSPASARMLVLPAAESSHVKGIALDVRPHEGARWLEEHGARHDPRLRQRVLALRVPPGPGRRAAPATTPPRRGPRRRVPGPAAPARSGAAPAGRAGEARAVLDALPRELYEPVPVIIDRRGRWPAELRPDLADVVFPVLHGPFGEDGVAQGHLETLGTPYVGCGVLASAVAMNKVAMRRAFLAEGIPVTPHVWFTGYEWRTTTDPWALVKALDRGREKRRGGQLAPAGEPFGCGRGVWLYQTLVIYFVKAIYR